MEVVVFRKHRPQWYGIISLTSLMQTSQWWCCKGAFASWYTLHWIGQVHDQPHTQKFKRLIVMPQVVVTSDICTMQSFSTSTGKGIQTCNSHTLDVWKLLSPMGQESNRGGARTRRRNKTCTCTAKTRMTWVWVTWHGRGTQPLGLLRGELTGKGARQDLTAQRRLIRG
jgi:hypothetical protein